MKAAIVIIFMVLALKVMSQEPATLNLMPVPAHLELKAGKFRITNSFAMRINASGNDSVVYRAANRTYSLLNRRTGAIFNHQYILPADSFPHPLMQINVGASTITAPGVNEEYTLQVDTGMIILTAVNTAGALHGLETLIQLCEMDSGGYYLPCVTIADSPRFQWRGLMIDVARHFISVDEIKRNIDAMAAVKMNVLHWHLTDDEGFRVESKRFPLLQQKGSNGDYYTQAELKEIVSYATDRGIMIVPEFDMPGHSQSWLAGYPELGSQPGPYRPGPRTQWQNEHPDPNRPKGNGIVDFITTLEAPTFDATNEKVYEFLDEFLDEMASIFPSAYVHIGADENNGLAWKLNPAIVTWMKGHQMGAVDELQRYFVGRVHDILKKHNKQMIGWEEIYNAQLPKDAIVHKWIPSNLGIMKSYGTPEEFAKNGYRTLISEGFYLDLFMPAVVHYLNPAIPANKLSMLLGGEAAQWTEEADNQNIDARIWPRAGAVAERLWSPESVKDVDDMYRRLFLLSHQLDAQGLLHVSNYERALRQISNNDQTAHVKVLTDVLTPVKGYKKIMSNMMKGPAAGFQTTPLMSVSDIVFVDSEKQRLFRERVKFWLEHHDKTSEQYILECLTEWRDNDAFLKPLFPGNKRLADIQPHSQNLASAAAIGLEALDRAKKGISADPEWKQKKAETLASYTRAYAETELAIIPEITALVNGSLAPEPLTYRAF